MSEKEQEKGTTHRSGAPGKSDGSDWTEHRDKARPDAGEQKNAIHPEERTDEPGERDGPTTHDDTRITSADRE